MTTKMSMNGFVSSTMDIIFYMTFHYILAFILQKLMKQYETESSLEISLQKEQETSVNDVEMVDRYKSLVGTIGNKFAPKRQKGTIVIDSGSDSESDLPHKKTKVTNKKEKAKRKSNSDDTNIPESSSKKKSKKQFMKPAD